MSTPQGTNIMKYTIDTTKSLIEIVITEPFTTAQLIEELKKIGELFPEYTIQTATIVKLDSFRIGDVQPEPFGPGTTYPSVPLTNPSTPGQPYAPGPIYCTTNNSNIS